MNKYLDLTLNNKDKLKNLYKIRLELIIIKNKLDTLEELLRKELENV